MTAATLYADENFPLATVEALRRLGHDVLTCREAGQSGRAIPDADVLAFATERGRSVLTMNNGGCIFVSRNSAMAKSRSRFPLPLGEG